MRYKMEELVPIVAEMSERYTGMESTSITYEKAEQLMGAVIYCIRETTQADVDTELSLKEKTRVDDIQRLPAAQAYALGYEAVVNKVRDSIALYNQIMQDFDSYGNECLEDTLVKGIPEFFKWYDTRFCPQDTILTLDYPVGHDMSKYQGVDAIYVYLQCIRKEQEFLHRYERSEVRRRLAEYHWDYEKLIENLTEMVKSTRNIF